MPERQFSEGNIIFREGEPPDYAYVITKGNVEILKKTSGGDIQLAELKEGDVFGEMGLFDHNPRAATARAKTTTNVDMIDTAELEGLLQQCPQRIAPIITSVFDRLRQMNKRVADKEKATTIVECDYQTISLHPTEGSACAFDPINISVTQLPLKVGGHLENKAPEHEGKSRLDIPCSGPPLAISHDHFRLEVIDKTVYLRDMGSRFGTLVDTTPVGRKRGKYKIAINKGEHTITLGNHDSQYKMKMVCA